MTHRPLTMPSVLADDREELAGGPPRRRLRLGQRLVLLATGAVIALVATWWFVREPMEDLTQELLTAARAQWADAGIDGYDLVLLLQPPGMDKPDRFDVSVRNRRPVRILCNGEPRTTDEPQSYTVEGLFDILERELQLSRDPHGPLAATNGKTFLRIRFHAELGYPERYLRVIGGTNRSSLFAIREFRPAE